MHVTAKLVRLFMVDKQLRGLQSRLHAAERFLVAQQTELEGIDAKRHGIEAQLKTLTAGAHDREGEMARLDAKAASLRDQMNSAQTNREYKAFLSELNTIKEQKDKLETGALELMTQAEALRGQLNELATQREQREQIRKVAQADREARAAEIKDRVAELEGQRAELAKDVPADVLAMFQRLIEQRGDDAMAPVEVQDRKRHEFTCGACQMSLPVESVNGLMVNGKLTRCPSCGCILYMDDTANEAMKPAEKSAARAASKK